jgi:hypothetical protein
LHSHDVRAACHQHHPQSDPTPKSGSVWLETRAHPQQMLTPMPGSTQSYDAAYAGLPALGSAGVDSALKASVKQEMQSFT